MSILLIKVFVSKVNRPSLAETGKFFIIYMATLGGKQL